MGSPDVIVIRLKDGIKKKKKKKTSQLVFLGGGKLSTFIGASGA